MKKVFLFAVIASLLFAVSCDKKELGLNNNEEQYEEVNTETNTIQENVSIDKVFNYLESSEKVASVTNNYIDTETGAKGTLYVIEKANGETQKIIELDKDTNADIIKALPGRHAVIHHVRLDDNDPSIILDEWFTCDATGTGCWGWKNFFFVRNRNN